ncbi:Amidophosphoribosyltransferase [Amphibalanus amphitrite]|uniref:Amidophosphoribosyltransferase n=1 Tax=Amphibalanus amphitrite TaxID=1232801 RepID=A0A6A4VD42_AMPAM|nr:Amidophosphoribosyltransferase [Amphibalanus amphitrite]
MPLGCQLRVAGVYAASLTALCCLLLLYCELAHHYLVLTQCRWPDPLPGADPGLRVMVVSDPHLLGSRHGHWFDRLRREWQMHRSYVSAVGLLRPQLVLFLGDLYDEGKWSEPAEFRETAARFERLFPVSEDMQRLVVAGNHDIGFHYSAHRHLWRRFDVVHNTSGVQLVSVSERVHLVLVNSVAMERDGCRLCAAAEKQLAAVAETLRCSRSPNKACDGVQRVSYSRPILVQHYPLYRRSDTHCRGPDSAPLSERSAPFRPGWECLSQEASQVLLSRLRPRLVLSGHTHHFCRTEHRLGSAPADGAGGASAAVSEGQETVTEYSVPSFSWRNRNNPSFLMVRLSSDRHSVQKCWMAEERTVIALYLVGVPAALVLSFIVTARRKEPGPEQNPEPEPDSELREACGVFGVVAAKPWPTQLSVAHTIYMGLLAIQHRGQESAGIVTSDGSDAEFCQQRGVGLVSSVFSGEQLARLPGSLGLGHTRYSTVGASDSRHCQPFIVHSKHGLVALAHNGELINAARLRREVLDRGVGLSTTSDSELIMQLLSTAPPCGEPNGADWPARIRHLIRATPTSYSIAVLYKDRLFAARDPYGNRPLCLGELREVSAGIGGAQNGVHSSPLGYVVSSESCAFQSVGAAFLRDVEPGEIVEVTSSGVRSIDVVPRCGSDPPAFCIFEYVYFSRPDSWIEGQMVYSVRERCGAQLAREKPVPADIVSTVPESATPAALGFARQSGLPYVEVFCKNRYVGRTFIQPDQRARALGVSKKFGVLRGNVEGRRVVIVDDSIVRGTTVGPIVKLLKENGAAEVHIRVASPPISHPCYMGINIPTRKELFANRVPSEQRAAAVGADSLEHLSVEGLKAAVRQGLKRPERSGQCVACLTGEYPVELDW